MVCKVGQTCHLPNKCYGNLNHAFLPHGMFRRGPFWTPGLDRLDRLEARIDVFRGVAKDSEVEPEMCPTMVARTAPEAAVGAPRTIPPFFPGGGGV